MKTLHILLTGLLLTAFSFSVHSQCTNCQDSTITGINASGLGTSPTATGHSSLAGGHTSTASGNYSFAFGYQSKATGISSYAFGTAVEANNIYSMAIGRHIKINAAEAYVIGTGYGPTQYLINSTDASFMVGFKSQYPTFFVGQSGGPSLTGKVAIGNKTDPSSKLHIYSDEHEAAEIKLEHRSTGIRQYAQILLGAHSIRAGDLENMVFTTPAPKNFAFVNGNVGINTTAPTQKLDVDGNIRLRNDAAIGTWTKHSLSFKTNKVSRMVILPNGNIGIGNDEPVAKFQVKNGDIFIEDIDRGIIMKSPDGNCWRGVINNQGQLEFVLLPDCNGTSTSVEGMDYKPGFSIVPNPASGYLQIQCTAEELDNYNAFKILDSSGKEVKAGILDDISMQLDIQNLSSGIYFLNFYGKGAYWTEKVVVQ